MLNQIEFEKLITRTKNGDIISDEDLDELSLNQLEKIFYIDLERSNKNQSSTTDSCGEKEANCA
jgi:hypothetical protein